MSEKWNGIPDNPDQDGWHWIGFESRVEPHYWFAAKFKHLGGVAYWEKSGMPNLPPGQSPFPFPLEHVEYLGPAVPPPGRTPEGYKIR